MKAKPFKVGPKIIFSVIITLICFVIVFLYKRNKKGVENFITVTDTENSQLNYIGCYNDDNNARRMISLDNLAGGHTLDECKKTAQQNGYSYYGLQASSGGKGQCFVSNDITQSTSKGVASNCIMDSSSKNILGGSNTNAIYNTNTLYNDNFVLIGKNGSPGNTDYPGNNVDSTNSDGSKNLNHKQCAIECSNNDLCVGFVTNSSYGSYNGSKCWLKSRMDSSSEVSDNYKQAYKFDKGAYLGCKISVQSPSSTYARLYYNNPYQPYLTPSQCIQLAKQYMKNNPEFKYVALGGSSRPDFKVSECYMLKNNDAQESTIGCGNSVSLPSYRSGDGGFYALYDISKLK